jgi:thiamine kinase-like enzyme
MLGDNYIRKTAERFNLKEEYPFPDAKEVMHKCMSDLMQYAQSEGMKSVHFIHGDLWFSNILLTFQNTFQFIDMKGICWKTHTTGGDPLYDYAKLYQSFLGYDAVLNGWNEPTESEYNYTLRTYYEAKLRNLDVNMDSVRAITFALVLGSLPFIADKSIQEHVWCWARAIFMPRTPDD